MTGKQHSTIGLGAGALLSYVYLGGNLSPSNIATVVTPVLAGAFIGSYMPDIDSKKSKASQMFSKIVTLLVIALGVAHYVDLSIVTDTLNFAKDSLLSNLALLIFIVNTVLGKLSGHRLYTHRWIGTLVFIGSAFLAFNLEFSLGFALGYILHILADMTTKDGKNLKFFRIQLPMTNSKGKFHLSY